MERSRGQWISNFVMSKLNTLFPFAFSPVSVMILSNSSRISEVSAGSEIMNRRNQNKVGMALAVETWRSESSKFPMSVSEMPYLR